MQFVIKSDEVLMTGKVNELLKVLKITEIKKYSAMDIAK